MTWFKNLLDFSSLSARVSLGSKQRQSFPIHIQHELPLFFLLHILSVRAGEKICSMP